MVITEERKQRYIQDVYAEMRNRGFTEDEVPRVIAKTGFMQAIEEYPEEQLHYAVEDAVDEIMLTASRS